MRVNGNYHITKGPQDMDFCVVYRFTGKTKQGEPKQSERVIGYHPNIQQAIDFLFKHEMIQHVDDDTKTILNRLEEIKNELKQSIKEI